MRCARNVHNCVVRDARLSEVDRLLAIKEALRPLMSGRGEGFILGSTRERYCQWVTTAIVKVLCVEDVVVGYAVCFPDAVLRSSELWQKKDKVVSSIALAEIATEKVAYFEQLAVLPRYRRYVPSLVIGALDVVFAGGHQHLFTTTVHAPFHNRAVHGLLRRAKARSVGYIREHYPEHGAIVSELHYLQRHDYQHARTAWQERTAR